MLIRRREQWVLLLGILVLNGLLVWKLRKLWGDYRSRTEWIYRGVAAEKTTASEGTPSGPQPAQTFAEIVNRNLFRPDRSNESPAETVKAPPLPLFYGSMNLGAGEFAMMTPGDQPTALERRVALGEEVGGYKLESIAGTRVVVVWGEKKFTITASESARRVPPVLSRTEAPPPPRPSPAQASGTSPVTSVASSPAPTGVTAGGGDSRNRAAYAGYNAPPGAPPDAPAGTIINGRKKYVTPTPFGTQVFWQDVEQTSAQPAAGNDKKETKFPQ